VISDFTVDHIRREGDRWCVSSGLTTRRYDALVSTIPIQELAAALEGTPPDVIAAVNMLRYNSLVTVSIGLDAARLPDYTAIYVPDPAVRFHRLSFPASFSPHNAPPGQSIIQAEITTNPGDGTHELTDEDLLADVINDLQDMDLVRRSEVCYSRVLRTTYGYVVQNDDCRRYLQRAKAYFEQIGIPLCGRVAEFEYINMDVCIERARKVAEKFNREAAVLRDPAQVAV
jgi:protoporphyrinogen oxidase